MIPHNSYHLLYIQTLQHSEHKTKCCFSTYDMVLPFQLVSIINGLMTKIISPIFMFEYKMAQLPL